MKKKFLLFLVGMLFIPFSVFAKEYNEFDIRYEQKKYENVNNTEIKVYAMVDEEEKLNDHTEDFTMEDVKWYKYKSSIEDGKTIDDYDYTDEELNIYGYLVSDEDVFEEDYGYFLIISRLYAKEEDSFTRNVKINGIDIDELNGSCYNTGNEFFIKTISNGSSAYHEKEEPEVIDSSDEETTVIEENKNETSKACMLGISLCCTTFLGLSFCIWILIAILLMLLIIICLAKTKKRKG